jgi:hypothetical protein
MAEFKNIPDSDHVLRWARPKKHLQWDPEIQQFVGCDHSLFKCRTDAEFVERYGGPEKSLSVNYVEHFKGAEQERLKQTVLDYSNGSGASRNTLRKSYFSKLNVGGLKNICHKHGAKIRVIHDATPNSRIKSHGSINQLSQDNHFLFEDLCKFAFQNLIAAERFLQR